MRMRNKKIATVISNSTLRGFTLVELLVTIGIFTVLTGVILASYRTYDSNALFANASEDLVLALRQAQVYGSGSKKEGVVCGGSQFNCSFGVYLTTTAPNNHGFTVFADVNGNHVYDGGDSVVSGASVTWPTSITVSSLFCGGALVCNLGIANISFKRPSPDAYIADIAPTSASLPSPYNNVTITLSDSKSGKTSTIEITRTGQISLQ